MLASVYNNRGQVIDSIELDESVFGIAPNQAVVHQVLVAQLANRRSGTAATKTRSQVSGSTRKLFRQKHTGRARAGSIKSPLRPGGGIIFGPHPRSYRQAIPKKMRRLALRCVLSAKVAEEELKIIDDFGLGEPKTREMVRILGALGAGASALLVTAQADTNVVRSAQNLQRTKTLPASFLNVTDLLAHKVLVITVDAVHRVEELWGLSSKESDQATALQPTRETTK